MRSALLFGLLLALLTPSTSQAQDSDKVNVEVFSEVLKTAEWAGFKYIDNVKLAQIGDLKAIRAMLDFSGTVDGTEALQHATTCLELIPLIGDEKFGALISSSIKPKLKALLLERIVLAQSRTKKEALRKPLTEWAPNTYKALNGEVVKCNSCMHEGMQTMAKPAATKPGAPKTESSETGAGTGTDTGKQ